MYRLRKRTVNYTNGKRGKITTEWSYFDTKSQARMAMINAIADEDKKIEEHVYRNRVLTGYSVICGLDKCVSFAIYEN